MRNSSKLLSVSVLLFGFGVGCSSDDLPGDTREPRCQPRGSSEPARLNIDTSAKQYGLVEPCQPNLEFYIARNTSLTSLTALAEIIDASGESLGARTFEIVLNDNGNGMLTNEMAVEVISGYSCRDLIVRLGELICYDKQGAQIDCPTIRLKTSMIFKDFTIDNASLNVCFDN